MANEKSLKPVNCMASRSIHFTPKGELNSFVSSFSLLFIKPNLIVVLQMFAAQREEKRFFILVRNDKFKLNYAIRPIVNWPVSFNSN